MWKTLLSMGSFDVDSLFNNIPLVETINNCVNQLFENTDTVEDLSKSNNLNNLSNCYVLLQRNNTLYLTAFFTSKVMM